LTPPVFFALSPFYKNGLVLLPISPCTFVLVADARFAPPPPPIPTLPLQGRELPGLLPHPFERRAILLLFLSFYWSHNDFFPLSYPTPSASFCFARGRHSGVPVILPFPAPSTVRTPIMLPIRIRPLLFLAPPPHE